MPWAHESTTKSLLNWRGNTIALGELCLREEPGVPDWNQTYMQLKYPFLLRKPNDLRHGHHTWPDRAPDLRNMVLRSVWLLGPQASES